MKTIIISIAFTISFLSIKAQDMSDSLLFQSFLNNSFVVDMIHEFEDSCGNYYWLSSSHDSSLILTFENDTLVKIKHINKDTNCSIFRIYTNAPKYLGLIKVKKVEINFTIHHNLRAYAKSNVIISARYNYKKGTIKFKGHRSRYYNGYYSPRIL